MSAISLQGVGVRHGRSRILDDISMSLDRGGFLAVLGPNGAGKSTLLSVLAGFSRYTGSVRVLDSELSRLSAIGRGRMRRRIGFVPQLHARVRSVMPLSAREVVEMGRAGVRGAGHSLNREDHDICESVMEQVAVQTVAGRPYGVLSGGEQRKVQLARALAQQPELLLLDEPAGHLDFRWQEVITGLIGRLWRDLGLTVVMVTHDPRHLPPGITAAALMDGGRILEVGPPSRVLTADRLSLLYGLPLQTSENRGRFVVLPEGAI
jgi:iron complex transport system ATP-binding protein